MATRCCSPPESLGGRKWARSSIPTRSSAVGGALRAALARDAAVDLRQHHVLEHGPVREQVEGSGTRSRCGGRAARRARRRSARPRRCPRSGTTPAVGRSRQPRTFMSVDLPEPDGPTIASESPRSSRRSTSLRATTGGSLPNVRPTPTSSTTAGSDLTSCSGARPRRRRRARRERLTGRLRRAGDARRAVPLLGARQGPAPAGRGVRCCPTTTRSPRRSRSPRAGRTST